MSESVQRMKDHLRKIFDLAEEIEAKPDIPLDIWSMKDIDKKSKEIQKQCLEIALILKEWSADSGDGGKTPDSGDGRTPNSGDGTTRDSGDGNKPNSGDGRRR